MRQEFVHELLLTKYYFTSKHIPCPTYFRSLLGEPEFLAGQIGLTTILVQGFGDLWLALRSYLPRPLDPEKYYQFGQTVKQRFKDEVPWMKDNINVTFHKVVDHPREILTQVPDTLRISLLSEEGLEVMKAG